MLWIRLPCHFKSYLACLCRMWQDAFLGDAAQQQLLALSGSFAVPWVLGGREGGLLLSQLYGIEYFLGGQIREDLSLIGTVCLKSHWTL